jgi:hypothetical protein
MSLTLNYKSSYKRKDNKIGNAYLVNVDNETDMALLKKIQGDNFKLDETTQKPVYHSGMVVPNGTALRLGKDKDGNDALYPEDSDLLKMEAMIAGLTDPTMKEAFAKAYAEKLMGK